MTKIPRHIDDPPTILFWDLDEFVLLCIFIVLGILSGKLLMFGAVGLVLSKVVGRFKQDKSDGYFLHILYWWGIMPIKGLPPSYKRSFVE
jgi:conjugal transfer pilus assembly protein TraL